MTLSVKFGEELGQNRHCPGVNGSMAVLEESIDPLEDVGSELVSGLDDSVVMGVVVVVVVAVVVAVVVTSIF